MNVGWSIGGSKLPVGVNEGGNVCVDGVSSRVYFCLIPNGLALVFTILTRMKCLLKMNESIIL